MTVKYDPNVLRRHFQRLYLNARALVVLGAVVGGIAGATVGGDLLTSVLGRKVEGVARLLGLVGGGVLGGYIGWALGFYMRLRAQVVLCQVEIESNKAGCLELVRDSVRG